MQWATTWETQHQSARIAIVGPLVDRLPMPDDFQQVMISDSSPPHSSDRMIADNKSFTFGPE